MKKIFFKIILIFILLILIITNYNYATDYTNATDKSIGDIIGGADDFINKANTENTITQGATQKAIDLLYNAFLAIGLIATVIVGVILGIQFMTASADGKAEVKEKLIPYTVGCVVVFGAFGIWKLVMILLQGF